MRLRAACDCRSPVARAAPAQERRFRCVFRNFARLCALAASECDRALLRRKLSVSVLLRWRHTTGTGVWSERRAEILVFKVDHEMCSVSPAGTGETTQKMV